MSIENRSSLYSRISVRVNELEDFIKALQNVEDLFVDEYQDYVIELEKEAKRRIECLIEDRKDVE